MLTLYKGSNLKSLAEKLLDELDEKKSNPLQPEFIILQNNGMKRWLQQFIARKRGIAANIETEFPGEFIWKIYHQLDERLPKVLPFEKEPMQFTVFGILQSGQHKKKLQPLYRYIQTDIEGVKAKRAWNLSARIADVFDRYEIYRPEMILKWQQGGVHTTSVDEKWQSALWNILQKRWDDQLKNVSGNNRPELHQSFLKAVKNRMLPAGQLPDHINIFSIAEPAPVFLEAFVQLSKLIDVNYYWLDFIKSEDHSLIESWGKRGRDFLSLFEAHVSNDKEIAENFREEKLQNVSSDNFSVTDDISIHSCHSPLREVEVLHDQLLALFEEKPDLKPEEVAVVSTDPELYAPIIEAVFECGEDGVPEIPFTVIEGAHSRSIAVIRAFTEILELVQSRFKVTDIMSLLRMPVIQQKLNISYEDLARLEKWVEDNNIRRGIDGTFKKQFGLPEDDHFSWKAGLSRMMLGYAMQPAGHQLYENIAPYGKISESDNAELLGTFYDFLNALFLFHYQTQSFKTAKDWVHILHSVIDRFLPQNPNNEQAIAQLKEVVQKLYEHARAGLLNQKIPFGIVQSYLIKKVESAKTSSGFGPGVIFSSAVDVRHIPFKVIGFLGMDEASFPKVESKIDFDLMQYKSLKGDPDQTEKQRYLFLNALLSAKETFYISYTGQSNRQASRDAPSVLVSELLNFIEQKLEVKKDTLVTQHRLQPFSPYYFKSDSDLFSYAINHFEAAQKLMELEPESDKNPKVLFEKLSRVEIEEVDFSDLIAFYKHPAKFILQNRLGIFLKDKQTPEDEREIFALSGLEKYQLQQELLEYCRDRKALDSLQNYYKSRDMLPVYLQAEQAFQKEAENTQIFYSTVLEEIEDRKEIDFKLRLNNSIQLKGAFNEYCENDLLLLRLGDFRTKDAVEWWLKHLLWNAVNDNPSDSHYFSYEKNYGKYKVKHRVLDQPDDASQILSVLVDYFIKAQTEPLPFFPKTSFAFAEALYKGNSRSKALESAEFTWKGNKYSYNEDSEDSYNRMLFKNFDIKNSKKFVDISTLFFKPYFKNLNKL